MGSSLLHLKPREAQLRPAARTGQSCVCTTPTELGIASMHPGILPTLPDDSFCDPGDDTRFYGLSGLEPWKSSVENSIRP
jgi:hypothetical protein